MRRSLPRGGLARARAVGGLAVAVTALVRSALRRMWFEDSRRVAENREHPLSRQGIDRASERHPLYNVSEHLLATTRGMRMKQAGIYRRYSTARQGDGVTLEVQEQRCLE